MLIVQRITTGWTKASRGGASAAARNSTPEALPLPLPRELTPSFLFHDVRCDERDGFTCWAEVTKSEAAAVTRLEPLALYLDGESVRCRFVWSRLHCGAPSRRSCDLFRLALGQWGRFTCNGRFGAESSRGTDWQYQKTVFNVALVDSFDENLFVNGDPNAVAAQLASLK